MTISSLRFGGEFAESTVAGWGATTGTGRRPATELQYLTVNVTDSDDCKYVSLRAIVSISDFLSRDIYAERGGVLTSTQICAGGEAGKDSCVGDSGSGLMRLVLDDEVPDWSGVLLAPSDWFFCSRSPPSTSLTSSAWSASAPDSAAPRACPGSTPGSTASSTGSWTLWTLLNHIYMSHLHFIYWTSTSLSEIVSLGAMWNLFT